jgi:hypothetical protein
MRLVPLALTTLGSVSSCYAYPGASETYQDQIVATRYDTTAEFEGYSTFTVAPEVTFVDTASGGSPEQLSDEVAEVLVEEVARQLAARGYEQVEPEDEPELGAKVTVVKGTVEGIDYASYWGGYGYYSPYSWGYYYPYVVPVYYEYDTTVLKVDLVDVRDARPDDLVEQRESGETPTDLRALWTSVVYGVLEATSVEEAQQAALGIDQAFEQSPYLGGAR